jgi:hypothetical protein
MLGSTCGVSPVQQLQLSDVARFQCSQVTPPGEPRRITVNVRQLRGQHQCILLEVDSVYLAASCAIRVLQQLAYIPPLSPSNSE